MKRLLAPIVAIAFVLVAQPASAICKKWIVPIDQCDVLPNTCSAGAVTDELETDEEKAQNMPEQIRCWRDENGDGQDNDTYVVVIANEITPRQSCCEEQVAGPHVIYPDVSYTGNQWSGPVYMHDPTEGGKFTTVDLRRFFKIYFSQISRVRAQNPVLDAFGQPVEDLYLSDLYRPNVPANLKAREKCNGMLDNDPFVLDWKCKAQVDHIIPRVDIKGCAYGTNSYSNALLISAELNNKMKNYCDDPDRVAILDHYRIQ